MAFGPIGRAWQPRLKYAGTYDQKWLGVCPSIAFRRRDSNNPVASGFQSPDSARLRHEQDLSRVVPRPSLYVSALASGLAA